MGSGMGVGTPPWPGDYRVRVHARGRDRVDGREDFRFDVWPAPAAPQMVHKHFDLLGYRLRGEPAPGRPEAPEAPHRWILRSSVQVAATITVVTGATVDDVLRGFGADPGRSMSLGARRQIYDIDPPCVAVTTVDGGVVAVDKVPKGLAAVFRFTGTVFRKEDLELIEAADLAYAIIRH